MRHLEEPKFTADSRNGENLSNLRDCCLMSLSPVHFIGVECP
jgi:hypothetical protein